MRAAVDAAAGAAGAVAADGLAGWPLVAAAAPQPVSPAMTARLAAARPAVVIRRLR